MLNIINIESDKYEKREYNFPLWECHCKTKTCFYSPPKRYTEKIGNISIIFINTFSIKILSKSTRKKPFPEGACLENRQCYFCRILYIYSSFEYIFLAAYIYLFSFFFINQIKYTHIT